jgi:predicted dehydrogenase
MSDGIRIGFIGTGTMGQMAHLRNYATIPECEIVAVAELRVRTGRTVARRYNIPSYYRNAADMLEHEDLDAVVASQPFTRHGILLGEVLRAGKPVFIEKPLAASVPVAQSILEAERASGTFVMVGYHKRSDPATEYARQAIDELLQDGSLGGMTYVRILMPAGDWIASGFDELVREADEVPELPSDPPDPDMDGPTRDRYIAFVNYYIHQVNLMRHLLGEPYRLTFADPAGKLLVGESTSGIPCLIEMSPYTTTVDWQEEALVCFERGWIRLQLPAPLASNRPGTVTIYRDPEKGRTPTCVSPTLPWTHAMKQQARNFIAAVKGERKPMTTASEALQDLEIARDYIKLHHACEG